MAQRWKHDTLAPGLSRGREAYAAGVGRQGAKAGTVHGAGWGGRLGTHIPLSLGGEQGGHSDPGGYGLGRWWCPDETDPGEKELPVWL